MVGGEGGVFKQNELYCPIVNNLFTILMKLLNGNLEERVLVLLIAKSPLPVADLIKAINSGRARYTKQGIYRVLRKLKREEKIVIHRSIIAVDDLWIARLRDVLEKGSGGNSLVGSLSGLGRHERVALKLKGLTHLDQVWSNIFINLESRIRTSTPVFLYNPHDWFLLLREETEKIHTRLLSKRRRHIFLAVRGRTFLDQQMKTLRRTKDFHCSTGCTANAPEYVAVLDEYVLMVKVKDRDRKRIDSIFNDALNIDDAKSGLYGLDDKAESTLVIQKNKRLAQIWRKRISREFY